MKRLLPILLLVLSVLSVSACDMGIEYPADPKDCEEEVAISLPFVCTYHGLVVLEGFLVVREEDLHKYDTNQILSGHITCNSEYVAALECQILN